MTNFNRSGFNPLRPNPNAPQQNRPIDSPAQEPQSSSRPAGHPEAGPSDTRQEARPQNYPSAADVAIHQRARFDQQRGDAVARADVPEASTKKNPPPKSLPQILKGLEPYRKGETLMECEVFSDLFSFAQYFHTNGGLKPLGKDTYDRLEPADQEKFREAIKMRKAVLAGGQSSKQGNVQNTTTTTQVDPVEQELPGVFANLPDLMPDIPELNLSSQQQSGNAVARADVPEASTKPLPPPKSLPKILKGLKPYKEGKALHDCAIFSGNFWNFEKYFYAEGGLTDRGRRLLYERVDPSIQAEIMRAIERRQAVLAGGQSAVQGNVQNAATAAPANPVEQELVIAFSSLLELMPDMPELNLFKKFMEAIEMRKAVLAGGQSSEQGGVQNAAATTPADPIEKALAKVFSSMLELSPNLLELNLSQKFMEAIEMRKTVLAGGQSSEPQTEPRLVRQRTDGNPPPQIPAPEASTRRNPPPFLPKILKGLELYKQGKTLHDCAMFAGTFWGFEKCFSAKGGLKERGWRLYEGADPSIQAEIMKAIEIRQVVLASRQSAEQGNVQNAAADAPAEPTRPPPPKFLPKILKGLEPYKQGKTLMECTVFSKLLSFGEHFNAKGGLGRKGDDLYERVDPSTQAKIREAIKERKAVLAGGQSSEQGAVQNAAAAAPADPGEQELDELFASLPELMPDMPELRFSNQPRNVPSGSRDRYGKRPASEPQTELRSMRPRIDSNLLPQVPPPSAPSHPETATWRRTVQGNVQNATAQAATHERARFLQQRANVVARADAPEASTRRPPPPTPLHGWQMPETPQGGWDRSRLPSAHTAPEIVDVDNYPSPPAATVSVAQRLANDPWLRDNDFVSYNQMLAELLRGQPGADRLHFVDPQQVQLLLNGDPAQKNAALRRLTGPNTPPILFLPVNSNNIHWSLLVVNRETGQAFHYDSMASPASAYLPSHPPSQFSMASQVANALGVRAPMEMPMAQQPDTYSCGDYVLTGIEVLAHRVVSGEAFQDGGMALSMIQPNRDHIVNVLTHVEQFERGMPEPRLSSQPRNVPSAPSHLEPATRRGADDMT